MKVAIRKECSTNYMHMSNLVTRTLEIEKNDGKQESTQIKGSSTHTQKKRETYKGKKTIRLRARVVKIDSKLMLIKVKAQRFKIKISNVRIIVSILDLLSISITNPTLSMC